MKLMKLKKRKNYAVFNFAGKRIFYIYIYKVFTWENFKKRPTIHYLPASPIYNASIFLSRRCTATCSLALLR
jgi:hypothetical protein